MRSITLGLLACLSLPATSFGAGISVGHELLPQGTTLATCLARAQQAIQQIGLRPLSTTPDAAWGENLASNELYTIYCVPARGIAVLIGASERSQQVDPTVSRLRQAFLTGAAGPARK